MTIMAPADENECRQMLYTGTTLSGPSAIRYPRGTGPGVPLVEEMTALPLGKAHVRREGRSGLALLVFGTLLDSALKIAERLDATVVNMRFIKPLDEDLVIAMASRHRAIITIEENATIGGAGLGGRRIAGLGRLLRLPCLQLGIPDRFIEHGSRDSCLAAAGLDLAGLTASIERWWAYSRMKTLGRERLIFRTGVADSWASEAPHFLPQNHPRTPPNRPRGSYVAHPRREHLCAFQARAATNLPRSPSK